MKQLRENRKDRFLMMRDKAQESVKSKVGGMGGQMSRMGKIKTFGELQDSIAKLRENFDIMIGKP